MTTMTDDFATVREFVIASPKSPVGEALARIQSEHRRLAEALRRISMLEEPNRLEALGIARSALAASPTMTSASECQEFETFGFMHRSGGVDDNGWTVCPTNGVHISVDDPFHTTTEGG